MTKKESQTTRRRRPEMKASASTRSGLLGAVSLLGVSLGASDAAPLGGSDPAASVKDAAAGEKLVQSVSIKWCCPKAQKRSAEPPLAPKTLQSKQLKIKPVERRKP